MCLPLPAPVKDRKRVNKFIVHTMEVCYLTFEVLAEDEEDAKRRIRGLTPTQVGPTVREIQAVIKKAE